MVDIVCPDKKAAEEAGLSDLQNFLDEKYDSYNDFADDLLAQLESGDIDPQVLSLLRSRISDVKSAFNTGNFTGDVNDYVASMGLEGISGTLTGLSKAKFPADLFDPVGGVVPAITNVKILQYANEYAKLGLYIGLVEGVRQIYIGPCIASYTF